MKGDHTDSGPSRPQFPDIQQRIGEDPARYLSSQTDMSPWPRLRAITSHEVASAWLAVARSVGASSKIQTFLQERKDELEQPPVAADGGDQQ
jgi:hypothetical protein